MKLKLFLLSVLITATGLLGMMGMDRFFRQQRTLQPKLLPLAERVYLTSQLQATDLPALAKHGIKAIFDMRPDGEEPQQPTSASLAQQAAAQGIAFHYLPVPHESIPDSCVTELVRTLSPEAQPAVLYCRTGRRTARLFALFQAAQVDGPETEAILKMVRDAGFTADDLKDDIADRVNHRLRPVP